MITSHLHSHTEWEIVCYNKSKQEALHSDNSTIIDLHFNYLFRRRSKYYEFTVIYPMTCITVVGSFAFILPNSSGEKITFSGTVFLSLICNLETISDFIPNTSQYFPLIGEIFLLWIFLVGLATIQSSVILLIHSSPTNALEPIPGVRSFFSFHKIKKIAGEDSKRVGVGISWAK